MNTLTNNKVTNITKFGFRIIVNMREYFVSFCDYKAFRKASIDEILNFILLSPTQLYWKDLDIDIELAALEKSENFPLVYV